MIYSIHYTKLTSEDHEILDQFERFFETLDEAWEFFYKLLSNNGERFFTWDLTLSSCEGEKKIMRRGLMVHAELPKGYRKRKLASAYFDGSDLKRIECRSDLKIDGLMPDLQDLAGDVLDTSKPGWVRWFAE